jgi:hypothetical protein
MLYSRYYTILRGDKIELYKERPKPIFYEETDDDREVN